MHTRHALCHLGGHRVGVNVIRAFIQNLEDRATAGGNSLPRSPQPLHCFINARRSMNHSRIVSRNTRAINACRHAASKTLRKSALTHYP